MSDRNFDEVLEGTKKIAGGAFTLVIVNCGQPNFVECTTIVQSPQ
jgi:hypothetical protein